MILIARKLFRDDSGAAAIEYGLIAGLIAVVIIAGATALGGNLNTMFNTISTTLTGAVSPAP
jgi:pilus assembly protein Flp/PilA